MGAWEDLHDPRLSSLVGRAATQGTSAPDFIADMNGNIAIGSHTPHSASDVARPYDDMEEQQGGGARVGGADDPLVIAMGGVDAYHAALLAMEQDDVLVALLGYEALDDYGIFEEDIVAALGSDVIPDDTRGAVLYDKDGIWYWSPTGEAGVWVYPDGGDPVFEVAPTESFEERQAVEDDAATQSFLRQFNMGSWLTRMDKRFDTIRVEGGVAL